MLHSPGTSCTYNSGLKDTKSKLNDIHRMEGSEHTLLTLGLWPSPSCSDNSKWSSSTASSISSANEIYEESSIDLGLNFQLHIGNESIIHAIKPTATTLKSVEMGPAFHLHSGQSTGSSESLIGSLSSVSAEKWNSLNIPEGSVSSQPKFGSCPLPSFYGMFPSSLIISAKDDSVAATPDPHSCMISMLESPVACTSGITSPQQRRISTKSCHFQGCGKGARGASGLCIAHGGGRRCQKAGCQKGAEGRTIYCKAHGGGRRCEFLGCMKSAEGRTEYCIAHGGGRRCGHVGCVKAARGKSGLCIRHGGGKRCQRENCTKSAEGYSGLCISHGGGKRCQHPECTKGAQGSTRFCKAHGGGKRCTFLDCTKGAEGRTPFCKGHGGGKRCMFQGGGICPKSVHCGTLFCVAHGGGKRCVAPECTKSARGRTDFCVRHGGGKRCQSEGCGKSAQGNTDFCKAHGGGRRCSWNQGALCDRFARGKSGLCAAHSALVRDECVHGGLTLNSENMKVCTTWASLPEGRVHGGGLMAILAANAGLGSNFGGQVEAGM